jgi:hypothetical protein
MKLSAGFITLALAIGLSSAQATVPVYGQCELSPYIAALTITLLITLSI